MAYVNAEMTKTGNNPYAFSAQPLLAALAEYDRTAVERARLWEVAESDEDVLAAQQADAAALEKVQIAFYALTRDRNSLKNCKHADIVFIRRCVG